MNVAIQEQATAVQLRRILETTLVTESSGQYNVEHPDYIHFPPLAEPDDPEAWPSYVGICSVPRYVTIAAINEVIFKSLRN